MNYFKLTVTSPRPSKSAHFSPSAVVITASMAVPLESVMLSFLFRPRKQTVFHSLLFYKLILFCSPDFNSVTLPCHLKLAFIPFGTTIEPET